VKMTMVDVMIRKTDAKEIYFSYRVAFLCIIDKVDFADPVRSNTMVQSFWTCKSTEFLCINIKTFSMDELMFVDTTSTYVKTNLIDEHLSWQNHIQIA